MSTNAPSPVPLFRLTPQSQIFNLCPSMHVTGGPESQHLLTHELRGHGLDARMVYLPRRKDPTPPAFARYQIAIASEAVDHEDNVLLVPEIWTHHLAPYSRLQKVIWWLSVDNYFLAGKRLPFSFTGPTTRDVRHLVGSEYARQFLLREGITRITSMSSYVDRGFLEADVATPREAVVLYNPKKGIDVVEQLRAAAPDLAWVPIAGLDREGVARLLKRSRVYIDFGHHPGKERLPREAALAGCCVITGRKGSAFYDEDVPVPAGYKFDDRTPLTPLTVRSIVDTIRACVERYEERISDFAHFRQTILEEKARFERAVREIFVPRPM